MTHGFLKHSYYIPGGSSFEECNGLPVECSNTQGREGHKIKRAKKKKELPFYSVPTMPQELSETLTKIIFSSQQACQMMIPSNTGSD